MVPDETDSVSVVPSYVSLPHAAALKPKSALPPVIAGEMAAPANPAVPKMAHLSPA